MATRTVVVFWSAVAAAVFLLGGGVASVRAVLGGGGPVDVALALVSALGLSGALLVAGRIVVVTARLEREAGPLHG
ncbi:MAG TPA: hypothetical protein VNP94_08330 [Actinomycetota bacterium]|nr:hypothetical protein [Actinomycetota bacterium]